MTAEDAPAPFAFFRLATSYQISLAIYVAAKLGIAGLLVIDVVDSDADKPKTAAFGELNLLLLFGGRQRSEAAFHTLFQAAGFAITRILPTQSHFKLIEAIPA
jgi:hypothetical protein